MNDKKILTTIILDCYHLSIDLVFCMRCQCLHNILVVVKIEIYFVFKISICFIVTFQTWLRWYWTIRKLTLHLQSWATYIDIRYTWINTTKKWLHCWAFLIVFSSKYPKTNNNPRYKESQTSMKKSQFEEWIITKHRRNYSFLFNG